MGGRGDRINGRQRVLAPACALVVLMAGLQGCALYNDLVQHGGSLPLGDGGNEWSPSVRTPAGGVPGVQIIHRF